MCKALENLYLNNQEIYDKKTILKSYPKRITATLTTRCNSKCIMCEVVKYKWDMPQRTMEEIKNLLPYFTSVNWQGGEVFLLDTFYDLFLKSLENKNLKQTIVTNGMLLNDKWIDVLTESRNMELTISIDGINKEMYEKIRYGSKYDLVLNNIKHLNDIRKKKKSNLVLKMHVVIMHSNYKYVDKFIELAHEYNFNIVYMMPIWGGQQIEENIYIENNLSIMRELSEKIKIAEDKSRLYGIEFYYSVPIIKEENKNKEYVVNKNEYKQKSKNIISDNKVSDLLCHLPWQQLTIDPKGMVRPGGFCNEFVGSIEKDSILNIWNNEQMQNYRKFIIENSGKICNKDCIDGKVPISFRKV